MDHHCPWIHGCVGEDNQGWFILSCSGFIVALAWHMIMSVLHNMSVIQSEFHSLLTGLEEESAAFDVAKNAVAAPLHPLRWTGENGDFFGSLWRLCSVSPWITWSFLISLGHLVFICKLFHAEVTSLMANMTRNEIINMKRYEHFKDPISAEFLNPFDNGSRWRNFMERVFRLSTFAGDSIDWKAIFTMSEYQSMKKKKQG